MLIGSILLLFAQTHAQVQPATVLLRVQPKVGTTCVYDQTMTMNMVVPGAPANKTTNQTVMTLKVIKSNAKEVVEEIRTKSDSNKIMNGVVTTLTLSPSAEILNFKTDSKDPMIVQLYDALKSSMKLNPAYPTHPVKVGDSWKVTLDLAEMFEAMGKGQITVTQGGKVSMNIKLTGFGTVKSRRVAELKFTSKANLKFKGPGGSGSASMDISGLQSVDTLTGLLLRAKTTAKMIMAIPGSGQLNMSTGTTQLIRSFR
ncbi:MAG: hypothetical protein ABL949_09790 [Fimbriimonadaceae bacterium]